MNSKEKLNLILNLQSKNKSYEEILKHLTDIGIFKAGKNAKSSLNRFMRNQNYSLLNSKFIKKDKIALTAKKVIPIISQKQKDTEEEYYSSIALLQNQDNIKKLAFIINNFNSFQNLIEENENKYDKSITEVLHIPNECSSTKESDIIRASIRVKLDIYEKFNEFCKNNKSFKKTDLLTYALYRFLKDFE